MPDLSHEQLHDISGKLGLAAKMLGLEFIVVVVNPQTGDGSTNIAMENSVMTDVVADLVKVIGGTLTQESDEEEPSPYMVPFRFGG